MRCAWQPSQALLPREPLYCVSPNVSHMGAPSDQPDPDCLRNELIQQTVGAAVNGSEFYRALYKNHGIDVGSVQTIGDLQRLPVVTKDQLRTAGRAALCWPDKTPVSHLQNTTGTTAEQFFVSRSRAETQFIQEFYAQLSASEPASSALIPLMLQIQLPHHGSPTPIPAKIFVLPFSVNDDQLVDYAVLLLRREFDFPGVERRVSILSGSQTGILVLTNYLLEHGIQCDREFGIRLIHLQGRYLTLRWRQVLEQTWRAAISNKYSLAEVFGGASWCRKCNGFHFDPHVVPEIIDFSGKRTLIEGCGVLLLTSLYPFVQLQPMIRYFTGDVFTLDPGRCSQPRFEFRGRLSHALFNPEDPEDLWLSGVDLVEALDPLPEINRTIRFRDVTRVRFAHATGRLLVRGYYRRAKGRHHLRLRAEVSVPLWLYPARWRELEGKIIAGVLKCAPRLAELVSAGAVTFQVEFVKPGTLNSLERNTQLWMEEE